MLSLHVILMVLALVCFLLAAIDVKRPGAANLIGGGLFLWALSTMVTR